MRGLKILQRVQGLLQAGDFVAALSLAKSEVESLPADEAVGMRKVIFTISTVVGASDALALSDGCDESEGMLLLRANAAINSGEFDIASAACAKANQLSPGSCNVKATIAKGVLVANSAGIRFDTCGADIGTDSDIPVEVMTSIRAAHEHLRAGLLEVGFIQAFEIIRSSDGSGMSAIGRNVPMWAGQPVGRLLVIADNDGIGDALQFARFINAAHPRCKHLTVAVHSPLVGFLSNNLTADEVIEHGSFAQAIQKADAYISVYCLPAALQMFDYGTCPYLTAEPSFVRKEGRLQIGLCWASSPNGADRGRTAGLSEFQPFAELEGIDWHSLVPGAGSDWMRVYNPADYEATARVVAGLDLVITVDTGVAHLSGAMGRPTWILLPENPCWRWETHETKTAWYPTAKLFRKFPGDTWSSLVNRARVKLQAWLVEAKIEKSRVVLKLNCVN